MCLHVPLAALSSFAKISKISNYFSSHSWPAMCIHGDKSQPERDWVLNGECKAKYGVAFGSQVGKGEGLE